MITTPVARRYRFLIILPLLSVLGGCAVLNTLIPWKHGQNENQDTANATTQIPAQTGKHAPEIVWRRELDFTPLGGVQGFSQPALIHLKGGKRAIASGCGDAFFRVLSLADGHEILRVPLDDASESGTLQLADGTVVVGDIVGNLYGIDVDKGQIRWRYKLSTLLLGAPVTVSGGFLLQTMDNRIYRFNDDGTKRWSFDGYPGGIAMHAGVSPYLDRQNDRVLAILSSGDLVALNADNGDLLWRKQLLLNADAAVLSEMKAPIAGVTEIPDLHYGIDHITPALLVPFYQGDLRLLNRDSGEQIATRKLSLRAAPMWIPKAHKLLLGNSTGWLRAIDTQSGDTIWKIRATSGEITSVVSWGQSILVSDDDGILHRIANNGVLLGSLQLPGSIDRIPVVTPQGVIVRTSRGGIYLIR